MVDKNKEKELFNILQQIKLKINYTLNEIDDNQRNIKYRNNEELENSTRYFILYRQYKKLKIKYMLITLITFGIYNIKDKFDYKIRKEILEETFDKLSAEYDEIIIEIGVSEEIKNKNEEKLNKYRSYYDMVDDMLQSMKQYSDEDINKQLQYINSQII